MALLNLVRVTCATLGTGTLTLGSPIEGFLSLAQAGGVNGTEYSYGIECDYVDGVATSREVGTGTWSSGGNTLTRSVVNSTNSNNLLNLSGDARVIITDLSSDHLTAESVNSLTEDTNPDRDADFVATYDVSAAAGKKVRLDKVTGSLVRLASTTASVSATIDFALEDFPGFTRYVVKFSDVQVATNDASISFRVATDAGAPYSYHASAYFGIAAYLFPDNTVLYLWYGTSSDNTASIALTDGISNGATYGGANGQIIITPMAADVDQATWTAWHPEAGALLMTTLWGSFYYNVVTNWTAIRFFASSGNIDSGRFDLYGEI